MRWGGKEIGEGAGRRGGGTGRREEEVKGDY